MNSVFDPSRQQQDVASKVVAALERLCQAFRVLLWEEAKVHHLSPIQIQFLVYLLYHSPELCRISQLAREFGLTQATVSDAIAALEGKALVSREPWHGDRRVSTLKLTPTGRELAVRLSTWAEVIGQCVSTFPFEEQEAILRFLMQLIESLHRAGIISVARMCITCRFFQPNVAPHSDSPHYCRLINKPLTNSELRIDCPDHEPAMIPG
ncbi:MAG: MarR family winged helix-turn-helix transcriptional regulator [Anaerolineae bacterium]|nr:MarR family winged helix-turn-helix transcriptional regulator [Anaerolineae bacterium]MDW8099433.1 MarR family winged helix-turn-helix transcriptional regulator [Anaerolineae bacterium]